MSGGRGFARNEASGHAALDPSDACDGKEITGRVVRQTDAPPECGQVSGQCVRIATNFPARYTACVGSEGKVCPFCELPGDDLVWRSELVLAIRDRYPVAPGHTLVITRRHVATYFDAGALERAELWRAIDELKAALDAELHPDGYNVGFNAGAAAGQTVDHLHVHLIPRFTGDMDDPRGGVRGAIPSRQNYLAPRTASAPAPAGTPKPSSVHVPGPFDALPAFVPGEEQHLHDALVAALRIADEADLLAAFVQPSGLDLLVGDLEDALQRGARIRVLTGDYHGITNADALRTLLRLSEHPSLQASLFELDKRGLDSFHPKTYIFASGPEAVAYVGSSNLSKTALTRGIEWNLRLVSSRDADTLAQIRARFDRLWNDPRSKSLSRAVIDAYEQRAPVPKPEGPERRASAPEPHSIQREALAALKTTRANGHRRGLVVMATGLGKTYLSAFDFKAMGGERALFVAHRKEILDQAAGTWAAMFPDKTVGTLGGGQHDIDKDLLFASVQTLSRKRHLARFAEEHFDYIVIDEFHHASASTYRKVLAHFHPRFLLGLTATPDRLDGQSLLELCHDNLVFRRGLVQGIAAQRLVPFRYYGVKDTIDFEPIPWRSGRFDAERLTAEVSTEARADQALAEYLAKADVTPRRTLAFCCSTQHADYMAAYFTAHGHAAAAVHSGPSSAPRSASLKKLIAGELEIICAVDVFNEGLDVPDINAVLMLRPTQSPVIFLQQLGRGLRRADGKPHLTVVDLIGNHRSFLQKPQALVYLTGQDVPPLVALARIAEERLELPDGCHIEIETDAIDMLRTLATRTREDVVLYEYLTFRDAHGRRPTAAELASLGVSFKPIRMNYGGWFEFAATQGDLTDDEARVLSRHEAWLRDLLTTKMNRSYKAIAIQALIDDDALFGSMDIERNARRAHDLIGENLLFYKEMRGDKSRQSYGAAFIKKWREMPLRIWHSGKDTSRQWFRVDETQIASQLEVANEDQDTLEAMTEELVELRLREHAARLRGKQTVDATHAPAVLVVSHSNHRPILRFDRAARPDIPEGEHLVEVDGEDYLFRFVKIAVNVATAPDGGPNQLPALMRRWFGPKAGHPGTRHRVQLVQTTQGWRLEQDAASEAEVVPFPTVPFYEDLQVACGAFAASDRTADAASRIAVNADVELHPNQHFVVRASGDSMTGGDTPIHDGDLVLCRWWPGGNAADVSGKPFLIIGYDEADTSLAAMKVPIQREGRWLLRSWNPSYDDQELPEYTKLEPVARVIGPVDQYTGLLMWGTYNRDEIAPAFGSTNNPSWRVGHRDIDVGDETHTILMVTLQKDTSTPIEHRYADRFLSRTEFQWESQASTGAESAKGRRIRNHAAEGRKVHLFVRLKSRQPMVYCGTVNYLRHEGEKPMRVWFELEHELPEGLWRLWRM